MKKLLVVGDCFVVAVVACSVIAIIALFISLISVFFPCSNKEIGLFHSEDGAVSAVLFERDCDATTALSYHVGIFPRGVEFKYNDERVVFTCVGLRGSKIFWSGNKTLNIHYASEGVFREVDKLGEINIRYKEMGLGDSP